MAVPECSILIIGESGVGKTHYGGQVLKRLMQEEGRIRMDGAAENLEPFEAVMSSLDEGRSADHTATTVYHESRWPIVEDGGRRASLIWPDYGGEQIKKIIEERRLPQPWLDRVAQSTAWLLLIRPQSVRVDADIFSRPLMGARKSVERNGELRLSDQARLVELLQILIYAKSATELRVAGLPNLVVLLTCWDELQKPGRPADVLGERLPMFGEFVASNWENALVLGVSALGRQLDKREPDPEYIARGSERFGYAVPEDGSRCEDLTLPILHVVGVRR